MEIVRAKEVDTHTQPTMQVANTIIEAAEALTGALDSRPHVIAELDELSRERDTSTDPFFGEKAERVVEALHLARKLIDATDEYS